MAQVEDKLKWCINKAKKEDIRHRGLKEITPDEEKASRHIMKAEHNLKAMIYLIKGNFKDWVVSASFYSMYHCLLAILAKHGYESRNQECTFACVEHLINTGKVDLDIKLIRRIARSDTNDLEEETIIKLREDFQYETNTSVDDSKIKDLLEETKGFIKVVRNLLKE